jgi:hypothetical protein
MITPRHSTAQVLTAHGRLVLVLVLVLVAQGGLPRAAVYDTLCPFIGIEG